MATRSRKLTGSAGALLNYFEELRLRGLESYYSPTANGNGESDDVVFDELWGKAAERLGIEKLTRGQFTDLANGEWDGNKLVGAGYRKAVDRETGEVRTERVRTTMIDVVYAAPKSVMELLIAIDDERLRADVIAAFKESVRVGFNSMEAHAAVARVPVETPSERGRATVQHGPRAGEESKMQGSRTQRVTAELLGLPVIQFSARPTDATAERGAPPDPHLHAHVPIIAVCWVPDGIDPSMAKTYTPDEQGIRATAAEREAVWMGEFARRLEDLGIAIEYTADRKGTIRWEIAGSNPAVRRLFSTNGERAHALTLQFEREHGRSPTNGELTSLMDRTRRRKDADAKQVDQQGAWERWHDEARKAGLTLKAPKLTRGGIRRASVDAREATLSMRLFDKTGLTREDSVFTRDDLRATLARSAVGLGFTPDDLARLEAEVAGDLIAVHEARDPRFDLFTTRRMVEQELAVAAAIAGKANDTFPAPPRTAVRAAIAAARIQLDAEQRAAVEAMCSSTAWFMLEGHAGTGKTATLQAVVTAYRDRHWGRPTANRVIVLSTAAAVAERTGRPLDADRASSIDSYVASIRAGARDPDRRTLILIDEAATVDTPRMAELLAVAGDARIICIGDPKQPAPIGPGGWYAEAAAQHGARELTRVYRQRDEADVRDYTRVREGAAAQALASLEERGRVHIAEDRSHAVQLALDMYGTYRRSGAVPNDVVIVLDGSNRDVDTVNRLVQDERVKRGEIEEEGFEVRSIETGRRWTLHREDIVIFLERCEATTWREVIPPKRPLSRYVKRDQFGPILPPGPEPEHKRVARTVRNGETGVIAEIDHNRKLAVVSMDRGDVVAVELTEEAERQPLGLAYGVHVAKYQGGQAPVVIALPSTSPIASQNSGYTQLTRAELEAHVIVDHETHGEKPVERLAQAWSRAETKRTALSQLDPDSLDPMRTAPRTRPADGNGERAAGADADGGRGPASDTPAERGDDVTRSPATPEEGQMPDSEWDPRKERYREMEDARRRAAERQALRKIAEVTGVDAGQDSPPRPPPEPFVPVSDDPFVQARREADQLLAQFAEERARHEAEELLIDPIDLSNRPQTNALEMLGVADGEGGPRYDIGETHGRRGVPAPQPDEANATTRKPILEEEQARVLEELTDLLLRNRRNGPPTADDAEVDRKRQELKKELEELRLRAQQAHTPHRTSGPIGP
jgi:AAA domain/TrwC relaxase